MLTAEILQWKQIISMVVPRLIVQPSIWSPDYTCGAVAKLLNMLAVLSKMFNLRIISGSHGNEWELIMGGGGGGIIVLIFQTVHTRPPRE